MVKRIAVLGLALLGAWSCATLPPAPPAFYVEDLPPGMTSRLGLDDRIAAEDAWDALKSGRVALARKYLMRLGTANPVREAGLAYADLLEARLSDAEARFKSSIAGTPGMIPSRVGLAQIYESRRERDKVLAEYREILAIEPDHRWAGPRFENLRDELVRDSMAAARAALAAGNRESAKRAFGEALGYDPGSAVAHLELGRVLRQEKSYDDAVIHFEAALEAGTDDKAVLREYAELLAEAGDLGRSLEVLEELAAAEPRDAAVGRRVEELRARLGVYEIPSQYDSIPALEAITREDLAALIGVKFADHLEAPGSRTEILVDIAASWAQKFIVPVASLDIIKASINHTFQPRRIINRAELADAAVRLIEVLQARGAPLVRLVEPRRIQISDVDTGNIYYPSITKALAYQIMALTPERRFEPERTVSGQEAIRVLDIIRKLAG
ncbi:MAG TPA: tetratricopeptide repeat protein [Candidatus Aminicenantes bacterium]|nr:tetratricopeptide repeat protein [Candidatus Aminicenantes bacterium]HDT14150.1 tetratricopeptide repeat protein [Candidatus Aminicenantes bacterium]